MSIRVIALGNVDASDDGAAMAAVDELDQKLGLIRAGRPGPGLLDLLCESETPVVLVDVVCSGSTPGLIHRMTLDELVEHSLAVAGVSSHGFGPAEVLRLGQALGRRLPEGIFLGLEGQCFDPGRHLSPAVRRALPSFATAIRTAIGEGA